MQAEYFALEGISELLHTVGLIRNSFNPRLEIEGVVLTMFDERTNLAQQVTAELRRFFGDKVFQTSIPRNIRLAEAPSHGKPALLYDPRSKGAESYIRLAKEIMNHHLPQAELEPSVTPEQAATMDAVADFEQAHPVGRDGALTDQVAGIVSTENQEPTRNVQEIIPVPEMDKTA